MRNDAPEEREMDLHHFFENMVRREETASAFLATLLDYDPDFRQAFLRVALGDHRFKDHEEWAVKVEEGRVDVTLESASTQVLIEDKLSAGAKQKDQLLRYYLAAVAATPGKRIVAVYLAPGGMGVGEVDAVERNALRGDRPTDFVCQLPWARSRRSSTSRRTASVRGSPEAVCGRSNSLLIGPARRSTRPRVTAAPSARSPIGRSALWPICTQVSG